MLACLQSALSDRYRFEREVGRGGMATVYLAEDLKHKRFVAIKVLHPELASMLGGERFLREIGIEARLQHTNILPLHDSGEASGFLYYVMPFVEGESLRDRLDREKRLTLYDAIRITNEVADALSYAHSHGVVHRDVKPENILLSERHAVLADFGIASAIDEAGGERMTQSGVFVGTPTYMSPEQASGETELDTRTDIYSLACVLYEMLAGEPPFTGQTPQGIIARHMIERPRPIHSVRPSVPKTVSATLRKALAKAPKDRFSTTDEFCASLLPANSNGGALRPQLLPEHPIQRAKWILRELRDRLVLHIGLAYVACAWLALELTGRLVDSGTVGRWALTALPIVLALGLPLVLSASWTQDDPVISPSEPALRRSWRRWAVRARPAHLLAALAALIIALLVGIRIVGSSGAAVGTEAASALHPTRIAVLPFDDQSEGQVLGHLALAIPEALIDQLSHIDVLEVLPYSAVKRYSGADVVLDSVIGDLEAGTLIEGTIIAFQDDIRITVRLFDANRRVVVHSARHQRPRVETLALLDDLGAEVSRALRVELGVILRDLERMAATESNAAWELYAYGREWVSEAKDLRTEGSPELALATYDRADSMFADANRIDDGWADPIVERGWIMYERARILGRSVRRRDPSMLYGGIALTDRALELDPENARALALRGNLRYWLREAVDEEEAVAQRQMAEQDLRTATTIDPNDAHAWETLSNVLRLGGDLEEARYAAERAIEVDQFYERRGQAYARLCHTLIELREWDEADRRCTEGREAYPQNRTLINSQLLALASAGGPEPDVTTAWELAEELLEYSPPQASVRLRPSTLMYVAAVLARAGSSDSARAVIDLARAAVAEPDPMHDYNEAYVRLLLGETDEALQLLERHLEAVPGSKEYVGKVDWWWEPLRNDPRFQELVG